MARLSMGHVGPRDLSGLANGLASASEIVTIATNVRALAEPPQLRALFDAIMVPAPLADELGPALADDLPCRVTAVSCAAAIILRLMKFVIFAMRAGPIAALQQRYSVETNVTSLKIKHNNVLGYHIDVRASHAEKLMQAEEFIHRQTTAQTVRFTTTELAERAGYGQRI